MLVFPTLVPRPITGMSSGYPAALHGLPEDEGDSAAT
jgi:hypothetical protein